MDKSAEVKLQEAQGLLKSAVEYVAVTQPIIDEYSDLKSRIADKAVKVAGVLTANGIVTARESDILISKFAEDPSKTLDFIAKLAKLVVPESMGKQAEVAHRLSTMDPYERILIHGDAAQTQSETHGMVD